MLSTLNVDLSVLHVVLPWRRLRYVTFHSVICVCQQYKGRIVALRFHGHNGYTKAALYYITHTFASLKFVHSVQFLYERTPFIYQLNAIFNSYER
jgi:hypothetical protein